MALILGIGGVSRSGKTWLAHRIKDLLKYNNPVILNQDDYVFNIEDIPKVKGETDWECPESIDFDLLLNDINRLAADHDFIIVEGLLAFYDPRIEEIMDKKIFIEIPKELFLKRKELDKRWGDFPDWYMEHIWDSFLKFGKIENKKKGFYFLSGPEFHISDDLHAYLLDK